MAPRATFLVVSLQLTSVLGSLFQRGAQLEPVAQLQKRNPYYGGFALVQGQSNCPASTETCATGFCCPLGTYCSQDSNQPYCCPTPDDCGATVVNLQTCADPTWIMFEDAYTYCCLPNQVGIVFGQCQPKSLTFSAQQYATTAIQQNSLPPPPYTGTPLATTGTGAATTKGTGAATTATGTTNAGTAQTTASKAIGHHFGGSEQAVLGGVIGMAAMVVPALL